MPHNKSFIDQASSVKMAGYWPRSLFAFLKMQKENSANIQPYPSFSFWVFKNAKRELSQYPAILTELAWSIIYTYYMASSASGQYAANSVFWLATRAGKMERYCPPGTARFVPANKISPKFKWVHESFPLLKLLSAKVKRLFVISLSLWNEKKRQREWNKENKDVDKF